MFKFLKLIRNHTNRQRNQGDTVDVATPILSKEVPRLPVFLRVLVGNQFVEQLDDTVTRDFEVFERDVEDEVISSDMPYEPAWSQSEHHVPEDS